MRVRVGNLEPTIVGADPALPGSEFTTRVHLCVDIAGLLSNEGRKMTLRARKSYELELHRGRKVLPLCSPEECPDFSYQTGCPGHRERAP